MFTTYGIREVPVLVVSDTDYCQPIGDRFHRVSGYVSLRYSLEILKKEIEAELYKDSQLNDSNRKLIPIIKSLGLPTATEVITAETMRET